MNFTRKIQYIKWISISVFIFFISCNGLEKNEQHEKDNNIAQWSLNRTNDWKAKEGWLRGCNFIASTAINQLEMWQAETFDSATIDRELGWAQNLGFNCVRVFLHHLAWEIDKQGFKNRIDTYLNIASKQKIQTIFVFFDDCWSPTYHAGRQPDPKPGIHNSGWVRDPGDLYFKDSNCAKTLEAYVKDILSAFKHDNRIAMWDLYNEAGSAYGEKSFPLLKQVFTWAREVNPDQPLTSPLWDCPSIKIISYILSNSDIITYHNYRDPEDHRQVIENLKHFDRPLVCTEYMARKNNSLFSNIMPLLKKEQVGALSWGFVDGKTNTKYQWGVPVPDGSDPKIWFHDILRKDGTPFNEEEVKLIKRLSSESEKEK
ncbi:MAG: glycoside hydrolase family 2 TIM barrel-domain containing protein [Arachidicoccus sp.]|nr:glycoside hydrolase family 2 TIM barrel-domain containing protein [Arachidicoccus sp.]